MNDRRRRVATAVGATALDDGGREYLYAEHLAQRTPWTLDAIEQLVQRRILRRGVHYFQLAGPRGRRMFKWSAIVELIEGQQEGAVKAQAQCPARRRGARRDDVEAAAAAVQRMLD